MSSGFVVKGFFGAFLLICGVLKSGSSLPTGISTGEQVLMITTTTDSPNSGESWEMDNNVGPDNNVSPDKIVPEQETIPAGKPTVCSLYLIWMTIKYAVFTSSFCF